MPGPNTATYLERLLTFFKTAVSVSYDNTESGLAATDVQAAIDEVAEAAGGDIATNRVLANVSGSSAAATATDPQELSFSDSTSGAGNIRLKVAPQGYGAVTSLSDSANVNVDITLSENGTYQFEVVFRGKRATTLDRRTKAAMICGNRVSNTLTMEGTQVDLDIGGLGTGVTITLTATSGNLRVNVANATGETLNGRVHVGWVLEDLI